jgi:hypothetical protein
MPALQEFYFDMDGLAFAFAALGQPSGEAFGEALGGQAEAGFEAAVGERKGVVEIGGVGEIAHGKLIEPFERAGAALAEDQDVDLKFLRIHIGMIAPEG